MGPLSNVPTIEIQPVVRKDLHIEWPRAEISAHWVFMGQKLFNALEVSTWTFLHFENCFSRWRCERLSDPHRRKRIRTSFFTITTWKSLEIWRVNIVLRLERNAVDPTITLIGWNSNAE
jgi:hypothetical protein